MLTIALGIRNTYVTACVPISTSTKQTSTRAIPVCWRQNSKESNNNKFLCSMKFRVSGVVRSYLLSNFCIDESEWFIQLSSLSSGPRQANLCLRAFRHKKFQLRMPSHSEGPGIWLSVWRFLLIHCLYERAAKVLARLRGCAGSPEPSLLASAISTKFAWRGPILYYV